MTRSPLPFGVHRVHHGLEDVVTNMTRVRKSPLPFGVHRVHHHKIAMDYGSDIGVSIAFRRSPRSPRRAGNGALRQCRRVSIAFRRSPRSPRQNAKTPFFNENRLHCLSAFTAFTTTPASVGARLTRSLHCLSAFTAFTTPVKLVTTKEVIDVC